VVSLAVSVEQNFIREFKKSCNKTNYRFSTNFVKSISPPESAGWEVSGLHKGFVVIPKEASVGLFKQLNNTVVDLYPPSKRLAKRRVNLVTRDFERDSKGKPVLQDVTRHSGSIAVISEIDLKLPFKRVPIEGFDYVDFFINKQGVKKFIYIIPKKMIHLVNQVALVISTKNMRNYHGKAYQTWRHGTFYLHLVPYKPKANYVGSKVICTKTSLDFSKEISTIVNYWMQIGFIPEIRLCNTSLGNMVVRDVEQAFESFTKIERLSLADKEIYGE
jgi:hypothetical protein